MRPSALLLLALVVVLLLAWLAWRLWGQRRPVVVPEIPSTLTTVRLVARPAPEGEYWYDVLAEPYPDGFRESFRYDAAAVEVTYGAVAARQFAGTVRARGLKPRFCYQLKLVGLPEGEHGYTPDPVTNERLGFAGRWWRWTPEPPWNAEDAEYKEHFADPNYAFEGYLLFAFFVTDEQGAAEAAFVGDSSYHVVWKAEQREHERRDGPVQVFPVGDRTVSLYGEWEPSRALPGRLVLPPGAYRARLNLTEESFHEEWPGWAQVMEAEVAFTLTG